MAGYVATTEDFDWQPYIGQINPTVPRNIMPPAGAPPPQSLAMLSGRPASAWMDIVPDQQTPPLQVKSLKIGATDTAPGGGTRPLTEGSVDTTAYDELVKKLNEKGLASLNDQAKGIKDLEAELAKAKAKNPGLDLSALMQLSDNWFGGNLSQGYQRPKTKEELEQAARALEMDIQRERRGLSNSEIDLIKSQLGIEGQRVNAQEARAARKEQFELQLQAIKEQRAARIAAMKDASEQKAALKENLEAQRQSEALGKTDEAGELRGINKFQEALDTYLDRVTKLKGAYTGKEAADIDSAYAEMQTAFAQSKGLGALAQADLGILHQAQQRLSGVGYFTGNLKGGQAGVKAAAVNLRKNAGKVFDNYVSDLQTRFPKAYPEILQGYTKRFQATGAGGGGQPTAGLVKDGYRFKGGDPSKQENWEPI